MNFMDYFQQYAPNELLPGETLPAVQAEVVIERICPADYLIDQHIVIEIGDTRNWMVNAFAQVGYVSLWYSEEDLAARPESVIRQVMRVWRQQRTRADFAALDALPDHLDITLWRTRPLVSGWSIRLTQPFSAEINRGWSEAALLPATLLWECHAHTVPQAIAALVAAWEQQAVKP